MLTCLLHGVGEIHQSAAFMVTVNCHPQATQDVSLEINIAYIYIKMKREIYTIIFSQHEGVFLLCILYFVDRKCFCSSVDFCFGS